MANRNYYRVVLSNDFLGLSKEISAPTRYELDRKVENQKRIWNERVQRELVRQDKEQMRLKADRLTKIDENKMEEYKNIIKKICIQTYTKYYNSLIDKTTYQTFSSKLLIPTIEQVNEELQVPKESFWEIIFRSKKILRMEKEEEANKIYNERYEQYKEKLSKEKEDYEKNKQIFLDEQSKRNKLVEEDKEKFLNHDLEQIEKYFKYVLEESKLPNEFVKDFELQYMPETKNLIVSYYLPNAEVVPRIIQHKYVSTRNEIDVVSLTDKKFEKFYNDVIYMCCLKTIKEIFESDSLNYIDSIVYNGWIKYIDKSTGQDAESCIITVETSKEKFSNINLENVDYKECIKGLKGIFAPSILSLTPVVPYMNINREYSRFIESKEVSEIALDGFNLATMPWEDFEYFVRELFDKMFNVNGGEVKVTQASHDGGVDAIAFDDDPIRGGKFVIQAKRYNNVVPVSAVRDLYGTMIHEGATKGILVTTSSYGKDAYDFSKDKPITLIDGQALLGLLNKYGYSNLTIKVNK